MSELLSSIVIDIASRCGVSMSKIDVSELTDEVTGYVLNGLYSGGDAIDALRKVYFFDSSEHDKKIYFPKRGAEVVATITEDDLVDDVEESTREQAIEFPKKLHLDYQNASIGYAPAKATTTRSSPDVRVTGEASVEVAVVLSETQALQTSQKLLKTSWVDCEGEIKFSLGDNWQWLTPSDCIAFSVRDTTRRLRIEKIEQADGVLKITSRVDRQSAYTSNLTALPLPEPTPPPPSIVGESLFAFLNIPGIVDSDDKLGYRVAVAGQNTAWYGVTLQRSIDAGANYTNIADLTKNASVGYLLSALSAASEHYTDTTNVVHVSLNSGTPESLTSDQFLSEGGAFAIARSDGTAEILQFMTATEIVAGEWELSTLLRGRLNTGATAHDVGAMLVMLSNTQFIDCDSSIIGRTLTHRPVSYSESPEDTEEYSNPYTTAYSQLEFPIDLLSVSRNFTDVISGSWSPRPRFGTEINPIQSINFTGYRVTISDGSATATFDTTSTTFSYDASAMSSPVTVSVSQLNRITGPGPSTSESV